jgi:membrane associated rhomboid family serine protease
VIIPLCHENHRGRRWPFVTIGIIALNSLFFLITYTSLERDAGRLAELQSRTLRLAAMYPDLALSPPQQELVDDFRRSQPQTWNRLGSPNRNPADLWELQLFDAEPEQLAQEMSQLGQQIDQLQRDSLVTRYAFIPAHPSLLSYLTANFLHGGWMHIIFNMWFLWLAGAVLEDVWGRPLYAAVYMLSGVGALVIHAMAHPDSAVPTIGASGAIAALMGAFLVRFPKTKIQLGFFYWILRPRLYRFSWPAYAVLPLWLLGQLFSSALESETGGGVAYWAHIGGFGVGLVSALLLRVSGIEKRMDQAIEAKVGWSADPRIVKAGEHLEKNELDQAIAELQAQVKEKPGSVEAWEMLPALYWKKGDIPAYQRALESGCRLHLKANDGEAAWQDYEDYSRVGDGKMPADLWMELCRYAEDQQQWERAADEYEKLAEAWPTERASVLALISAGRIHLQRLSNSAKAKRLYTAAENSPVPHRDWDDTIRKGLEKAAGGLIGTSKPGALPVGSGVSEKR